MSIISIRIKPQEYDSFHRAIPNDPRIPPSYVRWLQDRLREDEEYIAHGESIQEVNVHYFEFIRYCKALAVAPSYTSLLEYAHARAHGSMF